MNELTAEWVAKAEGDYATASRELRVEDMPNFDAVHYRYPGETSNKAEAQTAHEAVTTIRAALQAKLDDTEASSQ